MANGLSGKRIAILATDGFEESELQEPLKALKQAGAAVEVVAPKKGRIQGLKDLDQGEAVAVDRPLEEARPQDYAALVLPGGVVNADALRLDRKAVDFVRHFRDSRKPIAAICHGPWALIEADAVRGHRMTSWPSLKTDLRNAGADWVDAEVIVDNGLVTSRKPDDLPAFNAKMIEEFAEGKHAGQREKTKAAS